MRLQARYGFIVVTGLLLAGCRQADGPVPTPDQTVQEELVDVTRDLQNVAAARDPQAPTDLASDLGKYVRRPSARPAADELSRRAASAVAGSGLTEQVAQRLAHDLWVSISAREMSERQVEGLQNDVQSLLMSVGIPEAAAQDVAAQVGEVQVAVTDRPRRWYEVF